MHDTCVSLKTDYAETDQLRAKLPKDVSILSDDPIWPTNTITFCSERKMQKKFINHLWFAFFEAKFK